MAANPGTAGPGGPFVHSAAVTNLGPSPATGVVLTVTLPAGAVVGTITPGACVPGGSTVTCTVGALAAGGTFVATVELPAAASGTYTRPGLRRRSRADPDPAEQHRHRHDGDRPDRRRPPNPVNMRVPVFSTGPTTLTITNDSPHRDRLQLLERPIRPPGRAAFAGPSGRCPPSTPSDRTARAVPGVHAASIAV